MKKLSITITALILIGVVILIGGGYSKAKSSSGGETSMNRTHAVINKKPAGKSRQLIMYFTLSGNTKKAAMALQRDTGADIIRIRPRKAYPSTYDAAVKVAKKELATNTHPAMANRLPNLAQYKTIYIGFPTWWRQPPMIIHTLFDTANFKQKTIVPFTTSMASPISSSMPYLRQMTNRDGAKLAKGIRYTNNDHLRKFLVKNKLVRK